MEGDARRLGAGLLILLGAAVYFATLLKGSWLSDDYFITLRQVEQLFAGHGIRFNLYERAFLSTSVAYFFILLPLRLIASDPFVIHAIFALACNAVLLWLLWKLARGDVRVWLLGLGLLFASKAHFDYAWFGQENPLGHALVAALVLAWLRMYPGLRAGRPPTPALWRCFVALIAVAPLYRHDFVLLAWPLAAWALWDNRVLLGRAGLVRTVAWMLAPLLAWTLFSLVYFGFPLPAAAYNKVPDTYPLIYRLASAWDYYRFSAHMDSLALTALLGSQFLWFGRPPARVIAAGVALVFLYIASVGGDYMGGRFFTVAYISLVATVCGTSRHWHGYLLERFGRRRCRRMLIGLSACLVFWVALWPHSPLKGPVVYDRTVIDWKHFPFGVANERAAWQPRTGVTVWWKSMRDGTTYPDYVTARLGILLNNDVLEGDTYHVCHLGLSPYKARLDQNFLDGWGLADSFMTRLPATSWRPGHMWRARPLGLEESIASGLPRFLDPGLNRYFETLRNVTGGERLLSGDRIRHLIGMNLGLYDDLLPETAEFRVSAETMPDAGDVTLLQRLLESLPSRDDASAFLPLCALIVSPGADALLRRHIP